jgi:hypothetical protein
MIYGKQPCLSVKSTINRTKSVILPVFFMATFVFIKPGTNHVQGKNTSL